MIGARTPWLACAALALACTAGPPRGYYAPAGVAAEDDLARWRFEDEDLLLLVACQGSYVNSVGKRPMRTLHVQLEATRGRSGDVVLPLSDLRVDLIWDGEPRGVPLGVAEAWSGREPVREALVVTGWSRRHADLFFDQPDPERPPPDQVRLRWRYRASQKWRRGDCLFVRIPVDDGSLPESADTVFGLRNGYYLPGFGDLGRRELRASDEMRAHYLFHAPGGWF